MAQTRAVHPRRQAPDRQQCLRKLDPSLRDREARLVVRRHVAGANASANLYSLLQTCKANGTDGYRYLRELLIELPKARTADDFETLLPWSIGTRQS